MKVTVIYTSQIGEKSLTMSSTADCDDSPAMFFDKEGNAEKTAAKMAEALLKAVTPTGSDQTREDADCDKASPLPKSIERYPEALLTGDIKEEKGRFGSSVAAGLIKPYERQAHRKGWANALTYHFGPLATKEAGF